MTNGVVYSWKNSPKTKQNKNVEIKDRYFKETSLLESLTFLQVLGSEALTAFAPDSLSKRVCIVFI